MSYKVKLNVFEGPFDLLVYLIENAKMNIYDIQVSEITAQYIEYIEDMKKMDVIVASEFMVLAATLIDIKSKMLLPRSAGEGEEEIMEDPRTQLVEKLLEYKKFRSMSAILSEREDEAFRVYEKPKEDLEPFTNEPDEYLKLDIRQFVKAFDDFLIKKKKVDEIRKNYERDQRQRITTEARMKYIKDTLAKRPGEIFDFRELVPESTDRYDTALSFVSMLEMIKQRRLEARQKLLFGSIKIKAAGQNEDVACDKREGGKDDQ